MDLDIDRDNCTLMSQNTVVIEVIAMEGGTGNIMGKDNTQ
jgi:hypothetical protein